MPYPFSFDIHHIFATELFKQIIDTNNPALGTLGNASVKVFAGQDVGVF